MAAEIVSHQNARLSRGRHTRPEQGVCVMELASMLAGERFSDHPRSVCPLIGAFLRAYNDLLDDDRRQDLYAYAAEAVATKGDRATRRARAELCQAFLDRYETAKPPASVRFWGPAGCRTEVLGQRAAMAAAADDGAGHGVALTLLDALIASGRPVAPPQHSGVTV
ncbi:MAG TPA: hypothetical protein VGF25_14755 [Thermoleophilaceae bacterium]|jgi:hypothetical protein